MGGRSDPVKRIIYAVILAGLLVSPAHAEREIDAPLCLYGCPMGASSNNNLILRAAYVLSSNDITKFADWVAYRITPRTVGQNVKRSKPAADPALMPEETLEHKNPNDYKDAKKDLESHRGHQAPFAALSKIPNPHKLNYLSNITPQKSTLNWGAWKNLETAVRNLAKETGEVFVMTGPLYRRPMKQLPHADEAHLVPSDYWKIVAVRGKGDSVHWAAFVFPQSTPKGAGYCETQYKFTIREIEQMTGLDFFHAVSAEKENEIESSESALRTALNCF